MAQEALHAKDALALAFQYSEDGTIHVDKTQRAFFNSITKWKHDTAEIAMCAYRMAVALKDSEIMEAAAPERLMSDLA